MSSGKSENDKLDKSISEKDRLGKGIWGNALLKNDRSKGGYGSLKIKILLNTILILLLTFVGIQLLYQFVFRGHFANFVVAILEKAVYRGQPYAYDMALGTYQQTVRNYVEWYYLAGVLLVFAVILRLYLNGFIKYFTAINRGIDALVEENAGEVSLPPELLDTEKKINYIKHTLEQRKADAMLAEQRKNDLIVYLAHDLKTPLTSVIGYLTLLRDEPQISQELRCRYTGIALEKAERLEELINEFFDITRFNLTALTLETEHIYLSRMLEQITNEYDPILAEKELSWHTEIEPGIEMAGDVNKLVRVFDNLIRNAVNYSYPGTEIFFSAAIAGGQVRLLVKNHGRTIPEDKLAHLFEQFYRLDASRASATGGAGLGLAIAKEIVELHGGSITAASAEESITFTVMLPVQPEPAGP